jgi:hypothetical protein
MNFRNVLVYVVTLTCLAIGGNANASIQLNGSFGTFNEGGGSYSSSTLTLLANNYVNGSIQGDFVGLLPQYSLITTYAQTIMGLSSTPTSIYINNFFEIASAGSPFGGLFHGAGTPTPNQFDFNLATLAEVSNGVFAGTGTLVDTTGSFANSQASFTLSFSGQGSYSFTFAAVPEPACYGSLAAVVGMLPLGGKLLRVARRRSFTPTNL